MSTSEDQPRAATIGALRPLIGRVQLLDYDPKWAAALRP